MRQASFPPSASITAADTRYAATDQNGSIQDADWSSCPLLFQP